MPSIEYEYHTFEFKRAKMAPISEAEYAKARGNPEDFLDEYLEQEYAEFKKLKNPYKFFSKTTFALFGIQVLFGVPAGLLEINGYYTASMWVGIVALIAGLGIAIRLFQSVLYWMKSTPFRFFEREARNYFLFHGELCEMTNNYAEYLALVTNKSIRDYEEFVFNQKYGYRFQEDLTIQSEDTPRL